MQFASPKLLLLKFKLINVLFELIALSNKLKTGLSK
jgi:hypothetical protein